MRRTRFVIRLAIAVYAANRLGVAVGDLVRELAEWTAEPLTKRPPLRVLVFTESPVTEGEQQHD